MRLEEQGVQGLRTSKPQLQLFDDATLLLQLSFSYSKVLFALSWTVFGRRKVRRPSQLLNRITGHLLYVTASPNRSVATVTRALGYFDWTS